MFEVEPHIYSIFPVTIFKEDNFISQKQCDVIKKHITENGGLNWIANIPIPEFKERLQKRINYYTKISKIYSCAINSSWTDSVSEKKLLEMNVRQNACVSGILFININSIEYSLDFLNPNYTIFSFPSTDRNSISLKTNFKSGSLVMFPSFLVHGDFDGMNIQENSQTMLLNFDTIPNEREIKS